MRKFILYLFVFLSLNSLVYSQAPSISDFFPKKFPVGFPILVTGSNFSSGTDLYFGPVKANSTYVNSNSIIAYVPYGANYSSIRALNSNGMAYSSQPFSTLFNLDPTVVPAFNPKVDLPTQNSTCNVQVADFDNDGKPDLIIANALSFTVSVYQNISTKDNISMASFGPRTDIPVANWPRFVNVADFDNDGKLDLLIGNDIPNASVVVSVVKNTSSTGTISFQAPVTFPATTRPCYNAIGDIDGDGKTDFIMANWESRKISLYRNTSTAGVINSSSFAPYVEIFDSTSGPLPFPSQIGLYDFNGDDKCDIVVNDCATNKLRIYKNTSTPGTLSYDIANKLTISTGDNGRGLAAADFDCDGKLDLALANYGTNTFSIFKNTSTSSTIGFAPRVDIVTGNNPFGLNVGDVDGDGRPDLVTANQSSPATISIFKNITTIGNITFANRINYSAGNEPRDLVICDLDEDARPEIIVANYNNENTGSISIFKNVCMYLPDMDPTGINTISNETPTSYKLEQNFPNPFNPTTNIRFNIPKNEFITLEVYDSRGNLISTLVKNTLVPGEYEFKFDGVNLSSGMYFYKLYSNSFTATKKMMLIK